MKHAFVKICKHLRVFFLHLLHVNLDIWHGDMVLVVLIWVCSLKYLCSWAWNDTCREKKEKHLYKEQIQWSSWSVCKCAFWLNESCNCLLIYQIGYF
jgi:hypothetical protein